MNYCQYSIYYSDQYLNFYCFEHIVLAIIHTGLPVIVWNSDITYYHSMNYLILIFVALNIAEVAFKSHEKEYEFVIFI